MVTRNNSTEPAEVPAGASRWEADLYRHLQAHEAEEQGVLAEYRRAAAESGSPAFAYLADLIVEDETRHHRIFRELAAALRNDIEMAGGDPDIPRITGWGEHPAEVLSQTEEFLDRERTDARELRRLAARLEQLDEVTLWPLLVRLMEMDTQKHIAILEFVRRRIRAGSR